MSKVLYITANPKKEKESFSLTVGKEFINAYKKKNPDDEIVDIDVFKADVPLIDGEVLQAWNKLGTGTAFNTLTMAEQQKVSKINEFTDQFISADKYIFVTPMWNFTVPALMKAYLDTVCITGKTFRYTESGPEGLLKGKKAVHIQASGGIYSSGPASMFEMGNKYIKSICMFLGISLVDSIFIEGAAQAPDKAEQIKQAAIDQAKKTAEVF